MPSARGDPPRMSDELALYVAGLHDVIGVYHERLSEAASPQVAGQFLANIADRSIERFEIDKRNPEPAMDQVKGFLATIGMTLRTKDSSKELSAEIDCPFASTIHPLITCKMPVCIPTTLVLGAVRLQEKRRKAIFSEVTLTATGSKCLITTQTDSSTASSASSSTR